MRDADFLGYRATLDALMKWVVALDRTRYARSIPILLRDLSTLEERFPALYVAFAQNGFFMGQKTRRAFSRIPIDQCNEQLIDWLKNESAVIGNLDDPATIRREQVARPELGPGIWGSQRWDGGGNQTSWTVPCIPSKISSMYHESSVYFSYALSSFLPMNRDIPGKLIDIKSWEIWMVIANNNCKLSLSTGWRPCCSRCAGGPWGQHVRRRKWSSLWSRFQCHYASWSGK